MMILSPDQARRLLSEPVYKEGQDRPPAKYVEWPVWAKAVARFRRPGELGVGDTLARIVDRVGGEAYKAWYQRTTGKPCGCDARQLRLNETYSYAALAGLPGAHPRPKQPGPHHEGDRSTSTVLEEG